MRSFRQAIFFAPAPLAAIAVRLVILAGTLPQIECSSSVADELFGSEFVCHLRIEISESNLAVLAAQRLTLSREQDERPEVPAIVWERERCYSNVATHLKGGPGSFRPVESKPSLTLNFSKREKHQRFHGLEKISLNNSAQDGSFVSEKLCRELYLQSGIPVPRSDYATVELNRRQLGLYVLTEGWNKIFLKRYFAGAKGCLYDPSQQDVDQKLRITTGDREEGQQRLRELVEACVEPDMARRLEKLERILDLDRFITFLALESLTWSWDNYSQNRNNYRLFFDRDTARFTFMPQGMDQMFTLPEAPVIGGTGGLVSRSFLEIPGQWRRLHSRVIDLRGSIFTAALLTNRVNAISARLRSVIAKEGQHAILRHELAVASLNERIRRRVASIDEQLNGFQGLLELGPGQTVPLTNWPVRIESSNGSQPSETSDLLHLRQTNVSTGIWFTKVWLEAGRYVVEGRARTAGIAAAVTNAYTGAGLRVWSPRKQSKGNQWSWFPGAESMDKLRRGECTPTNAVPPRLYGNNDWTPICYEIDLREPMADLEVWCELRAACGEAWYDPMSLRITRK